MLANICLFYRINEQGKAHVDRNMPAMTGQLKWSTELKGKMTHSVKGFTDLNHPICYKESSKIVLKKYKDIMEKLYVYEEEIFELWNRSISSRISQNLNRPLVLRDTSRGTIKVNLSREIVSLLRDVSYILNFE